MEAPHHYNRGKMLNATRRSGTSWVNVDQVAGMMDVPIGNEFQTALGFAVSTDLLLVDDTRTPAQVCLTHSGVVLAKV